MTLVNYKAGNYAHGELLASVNSVTTTFVVKSGQGARYPSTFPYVCKVFQLDTAGDIVKQEVVKVTNRVSDTFTVVRSWENIPPTATSNTPGNTAYDFDTTDGEIYFNQVYSKAQQDDMNAELVRLETDKLDISDYISGDLLFEESNTGTDAYQVSIPEVTSYAQVDGQTFRVRVDVDNTGAATFQINVLSLLSLTKRGGDALATGDITANQIMVVAINNQEGRAEVIETIDQRTQGVTEALIDTDTYRVGEDVSAGESVFREDMIEFAETVNATVVTDTGGTFNVTSNTPQSRGHRMYAEKPILIVSVTKDAASAATQATIKDDAGATLATQAFVGNVATFATEVVILQKTYFRIEADAAGASYDSRVRIAGTYPVAGTNVDYVTGSAAGANTAQSANLVSIQTIEYTIQKIGDTSANTRVSAPVFGSGIAASTFKLSLKKYVSPGVNLGVRIETDNAGSPSGTLIDANATATVTAASLSTSLADTTVTLAGSVTIPKGTKCHIVLFAGTYGAETINSTNFFGVGFQNINTTTRFMKIYDGSAWYTAFTYSAVVDDDNTTITTNQATTNARGWKFQAIYDLTLTTVTKNSNVTATRAIIKNAGGTTLTTQAFSGNVATLAAPQTFSALDYFIIELDSSGASYTSRYLSPATIPQVRTNVTFVEGSENGGSTTTQVFNIDSITTQRYMNISDNMIYASGNLFEAKLLSLTDTRFEYKIPTDIPRIAIESSSAGNECICTTYGINSQVSGLTPLSNYFLQDTPGAIGATAGTFWYCIGEAIDATNLFVSREFIKRPMLATLAGQTDTSPASASKSASFSWKTNGKAKLVQFDITLFQQLQSGANSTAYNTYRVLMDLENQKISAQQYGSAVTNANITTPVLTMPASYTDADLFIQDVVSFSSSILSVTADGATSNVTAISSTETQVTLSYTLNGVAPDVQPGGIAVSSLVVLG